MQAMRDEVSRVVPDSGRREKLSATLDRYEERLRAFGDTVSSFQGGFRALNADVGASRAQFDDLIASYQADRKATRSQLLQIHQELLSLTTEGEWRSIGRREVDVLRLADPGERQEQE